MGIATKNSILLVEYAIVARRGGMGRFDALVAPTSPSVAFRLGARMADPVPSVPELPACSRRVSPRRHFNCQRSGAMVFVIAGLRRGAIKQSGASCAR